METLRLYDFFVLGQAEFSCPHFLGDCKLQIISEGQCNTHTVLPQDQPFSSYIARI